MSHFIIHLYHTLLYIYVYLNTISFNNLLEKCIFVQLSVFLIVFAEASLPAACMCFVSFLHSCYAFVHHSHISCLSFFFGVGRLNLLVFLRNQFFKLGTHFFEVFLICGCTFYGVQTMTAYSSAGPLNDGIIFLNHFLISVSQEPEGPLLFVILCNPA